MKVRIADSAWSDIDSAIEYYHSVSYGLGSHFLNSILSDIESISFYAGIHYKEHNHFRLISKRFPFAIYYIILNDTAIVEAVIDCRSNPESIKERLQ